MLIDLDLLVELISSSMRQNKCSDIWEFLKSWKDNGCTRSIMTCTLNSTNRKTHTRTQNYNRHRFINYLACGFHTVTGCCVNILYAGRQVPIFSYFSQHTPIFPIFFSNFLLFFLFFSHFTYNKQIFVRDLNILSLFKYVVYRVH